MFVFRLLPTFLLFLLLSGGQVLLVSGQAYGQPLDCCPCFWCGKDYTEFQKLKEVFKEKIREGRQGDQGSQFQCACGCDCKPVASILEIEQSLMLIQTELGNPVPIDVDPKVLPKVKRGSYGKFSLRLLGDAEKGLQFKCIDFEPLEKGAPITREIRNQTEEFQDFSKFITQPTGRKPKK
jgi:hypothetical protein